jgi:quercetin dioxygenase-like cupin family protein
MKRIYNSALAKLALFKLNGLNKYEYVEIPRVPDKWEKTDGSEDMHMSITTFDNYTSLVYIGREGSVYPPHKHKYASEQITILNEGGEIELITESEIKTVKFPNSLYIKAGEVHAMKFNTETKIIVLWTPSFDNHEIKGDFMTK